MARTEPTSPYAFTLKSFLISLGAAAAGGILMAVVFVPDEAPSTPVQTVFFGAVTGILIGLPFMYVERIFGELLDRLRNPARYLLRGVGYLMAAVIGFGLGFPVAGLVVYGELLRIPFSAGLFVGAIVATGIAFVIYGYGVLRRRLEKSLERIKEQELAEKELEIAREIQTRLLPPPEIEGEGYRVVARNLPATYVAGDFYDVFPLGDGTIGLAVADVAGKGMGASLIMSTAKAMLPLIATDRTVAQTLTELNTRLSDGLGRREFVALSFSRFDPVAGRVEIGNAGLPNPYVVSDSRVEEIEVPGPRVPLGAMKSVRYESVSFDLSSDQWLVMLSDGLPEAPIDGDGAQIGYEALKRIMSRRSELQADRWLDRILEDVVSMTVDGPDDDCTVLVLERRR